MSKIIDLNELAREDSTKPRAAKKPRSPLVTVPATTPGLKSMKDVTPGGSLEAWGKVAEEHAPPLSLEAMDEMLVQLQDEKTELEKAEAVVDQKREIYEATRAKVLGALKRSKKTKYSVDGLGTAYISTKFVVKCPKDLQSKKLLFAAIRLKYDEPTLMGMLSINHQTLNSWYNAEAEAHAEKKVPFELKGLEPPTSHESLGFRSERKKKGK